jgi:hypothetical protein
VARLTRDQVARTEKQRLVLVPSRSFLYQPWPTILRFADIREEEDAKNTRTWRLRTAALGRTGLRQAALRASAPQSPHHLWLTTTYLGRAPGLGNRPGPRYPRAVCLKPAPIYARALGLVAGYRAVAGRAWSPLGMAVGGSATRRAAPGRCAGRVRGGGPAAAWCTIG